MDIDFKLVDKPAIRLADMIVPRKISQIRHSAEKEINNK
jgi:hypothetical protein